MHTNNHMPVSFTPEQIYRIRNGEISIPEYRIRTKCVVCGNKSIYSQFKELLGGYRDMKYCSMECFVNSNEEVK